MVCLLIFFIDNWSLLGTVMQAVCCSRVLGGGSWRSAALCIQVGALGNACQKEGRAPVSTWSAQAV